MITTLLFDLGGVLFTNGTKEFVRTFSSKFNFEHSLVTDLLDGEIGTSYREGKISRDEFWSRFLGKLNLSHLDIEQVENEWIYSYKLIEETRDIILSLSKRYKIYYLSDNVRERVEKINSKHDFLKWFEGGIFSHEAGVRKPHPDVYLKALELTQSKPEETIFIDDKKINLPPAEKLGMKTILFTSPESLEIDLKGLGIT